ncbi:hypothetical protein VP01_2530g3, partial [Puccinia sorghi]
LINIVDFAPYPCQLPLPCWLLSSNLGYTSLSYLLSNLNQKEEPPKKQKKEPERPNQIQPTRKVPEDLPASVSSVNHPPPPKKFCPIKAVKPFNHPQTFPEIPKLIKRLPSYIQHHVQKVLDVESDQQCQENFMEVHQKLLAVFNTCGKWYVDQEIMDQETLDKLKRKTELI